MTGRHPREWRPVCPAGCSTPFNSVLLFSNVSLCKFTLRPPRSIVTCSPGSPGLCPSALLVLGSGECAEDTRARTEGQAGWEAACSLRLFWQPVPTRMAFLPCARGARVERYGVRVAQGALSRRDGRAVLEGGGFGACAHFLPLNFFLKGNLW